MAATWSDFRNDLNSNVSEFSHASLEPIAEVFKSGNLVNIGTFITGAAVGTAVVATGSGDINSALQLSSVIDQSGVNSYSIIREFGSSADKTLTNLTETLQSQGIAGDTAMGELISQPTTVLAKAAGAFSRITKGYNDGVTETEFGDMEQASWETFINYMNSSSAQHKINILRSTPLDPGTSKQDLYGNMMLGAPFLMTNRTDPHNRNMINTFIKDSRFLSLTPGLPKFNGSRYTHYGIDNGVSVNALKQTETGVEMFEYLLKNGVDKNNLDKDKRYYSFKPEYSKFYSYLETFLNMVWIKLGLGTEGDGTFNMMSFFGTTAEEVKENSGETAEPLAQYQGAFGIFVNPSGAITENITNERTNFGGELGAETNNNNAEFQRINYLTGMGTAKAGSLDSTRALVGKSMLVTQNLKNLLSNTFQNTVSGWTNNNGVVRKITGAALGALTDVLGQYTKTDIGSTIQAYTTTNGMQVKYPELWSDGSYTKSMNFQFSFSSPYGDPLSIFKYVYVPFGVLLAFTLQRQADDNGYVSPFFVRADLPGYFTCDLGFISNMTFTRGGPNGLFTKDGLPRCISGDFTIEDLYPYLAMSRRLSFLSANPSYTSFVDSMVGLNAINNEANNSTIDEYWYAMLNRVNGNGGTLWNKFNSEGRALHKDFGDRSTTTLRESKFQRSSLNNISWFRKI